MRHSFPRNGSIRLVIGLLALSSSLALLRCGSTAEMLPGPLKLIQIEHEPPVTAKDFAFFLRLIYPEVAESKDPVLLSSLFDQFQNEVLLAGLAESLGYRTAEDAVSTFVQQRLTTMSIHLLPPREQDLWRKIIRRRLAIAEMVRENLLKRISLSDSAIHDYYQTNQARFQQETYYRLHFFTSEEEQQATALVEELRDKKKSFSEVAAKYASDQSFAVQIVVGEQALLPEFRTALAGLRPGSATKAIPISHGQLTSYYVIYSEGVIAAETISMDDAYPVIRGTLESSAADKLLRQELDQFAVKAKVQVFKKNLPFTYIEPAKRSSGTP